MLRAEVGRQGRLDVVPGILFSAIIWEPRTPAQALHWSNHLTALLSQLPLQLRILEDILGCRAYWSQHLLAATRSHASVSNMLQSARTPSPAIGAGQGGRGTWTQTHGII